ncbi:methionine ABC transporter ATP-binding protein [Microbacterium sp. YY-01]|uniref:methionine ABC transporter ATP-binding protein n=1 Tax=Microbacterium sp. YY-01 TaxID=3421634 RepID=UPI003D168E50
MTAALRDVSVEVPAGKIFGVIGYSGAGKSTLIRTVNGLERPTRGHVWVDDVDVASLHGAALREAQKRSGMIFQQFNLLDTVRVRDNVAIPLRLDGTKKDEARRRAEEALEFVGLSDKSDAYPGELSGGQKQRVAIARALVRRPKILLADEATSALDPSTTALIIQLLRDINREYGTTILVVTHEMEVIKDLADEVAVMESGQVVEHGSVLDVFVRPQQPITRDFVGSIIQQKVPRQVIDHLGSAGLWRLLLLGDETAQPLMHGLITQIGVDVNMLHAEMTEIHDRMVGQMIVKVDGTPEQVAAARTYLADRVVSVEDLEA